MPWAPSLGEPPFAPEFIPSEVEGPTAMDSTADGPPPTRFPLPPARTQLLSSATEAKPSFPSTTDRLPSTRLNYHFSTAYPFPAVIFPAISATFRFGS